MADNVAITAGAGTTVATDEVNTGGGAAHVQLMKLLDGTDGGTERIQGTAANGLEVDVTRVVPGTSASSLGKAEDAAHTTGDVGVMALSVRQDTAAALGGTDADYQPLITDASGRLHVNVGNTVTVGSHAVTNAGTFAVQVDGAALTALQLIDNLVLAEDAAHVSADPGIQALTVRQDTAAALGGTDGDYQPLVTDASGRLHVNVGNTVTVASHAVTNAGTFVVQENGAALTALQLIDNLVLAEDAAHQTGDVGVQMLAVRDDTLNIRSGAENDYEPLHTNADGALWTIDVNSAASAASLSVLDDWDESDRAKVNLIAGQAGITAGAGSVAASTPRVTLASDDPAVAALQIMDDWDNGASDGASVSGDVAHDTADAGEPVKLGHKAIDLGANPTDVAANDRTNWYSMRNGVPFVMGGAPFVKSQNLQVTDADGAQTDTAIVSAAANVAIMVTCLEVTADNANTGDVSVRIGFGATNTPAADADKVILFHPGIAPGSGLVKGSGSGIIGAGLSDEDLRVTCEDPAGGSVSITVTYFTLAIG